MTALIIGRTARSPHPGLDRARPLIALMAAPVLLRPTSPYSSVSYIVRVSEIRIGVLVSFSGYYHRLYGSRVLRDPERDWTYHPHFRVADWEISAYTGEDL